MLDNKIIKELFEKKGDIKISLDFDDVLNKIHVCTNAYLKEHYGVEINPKDIPTWAYLVERYPKIINAWGDFNYYGLSTPIEGSINFVETLKKIFGAHNIQIVTNTYPSIIIEKTKMIHQIYGVEQIFHTSEKYKYTKGTILIDDALHNIEAHIKTDSPGIIFDLGYGWNQEKMEEQHENVYRAKSYNDVLKILHQMID